MTPPRALVIGGSAGAFGVACELLAALSPAIAFPVFLVLHQPRKPVVALAEILSSHLTLPVREATDKMPIKAGWLYTAPADYHLSIEDAGHMALDDGEKVCFSRPAIDVLFRSAAAVYGAGLVGLLLSGANQDGAAGLAAIAAAGGATLVQAPADAEFPAMPAAALALFAPLRVAPRGELATWLVSHSGVMQ